LIAVGALLAFAPSAQAAELLAAYEHYVPGQGFQIGLVNASTGEARTLPAGVNTTDDELHPTLSPDGRYLAFTRMRLLPKLNGDVAVPAQRTVVLVDLQARQIVPFAAGVGGAGPNFMRHGIATTLAELAWGITPVAENPPRPDGSVTVAAHVNSFNFNATPFRSRTELAGVQNVFVPHAAIVRSAFTERLDNHAVCTPICSSPRDLRLFTLALIDPVSGAVTDSRVRLATVGIPDSSASVEQTTLRSVTLGASGKPAGHPVARAGDEFVALDRSLGADSDIHTITFPGETSTTVAPAPITTKEDERMPAWSPDSLQLGFVRTSAGRRALSVYDLTPGIQAILNPPVDLGADAPTPQLRAFQSLWGNLSLSAITAAPRVVCDAACVNSISNSVLRPTISDPIPGVRVGIFIVRRTGGTRTVLGVKQPKIKVVGRVPLGKAKRGRNRFTLTKRLKPGKYLVTYRLLRDDRVTTVSKSVPLTIKR
jgi:hypothetical protein